MPLDNMAYVRFDFQQDGKRANWIRLNIPHFGEFKRKGVNYF